MATFHFRVRIGKKGKAGPHAEYITGRNKRRTNRREDVVHSEAGNLPAWTLNEPSRYWNASDLYERKNGTVYREFEFSLPKELTTAQHILLVRHFVEQELGNIHVYEWAIHRSKSRLAGVDHPHVHIQFSERMLDGMDRDPVDFFRRYNPAKPEKGGCKKSSTALDWKNRRTLLQQLRGRWAELQNEFLAHYGYTSRVDHRSLLARGIDRSPEKYLGPFLVQAIRRFPEKLKKFLEIREARITHDRTYQAITATKTLLHAPTSFSDQDEVMRKTTSLDVHPADSGMMVSNNFSSNNDALYAGIFSFGIDGVFDSNEGDISDEESGDSTGQSPY